MHFMGLLMPLFAKRCMNESKQKEPKYGEGK